MHNQREPTPAEQTPQETVGRRMRFLRGRDGLSQAALAERLTHLGMKVDGSAVTRMERGTRAITVNELVTIASAFDVPLASLLRQTSSVAEVELALARQDEADLRREAAVIATELDAVRARIERLANELRDADDQEIPIPGSAK
ncbi:MAG: helix-turn-helix domain-containing protein [Pseudonocardiaceae bacterium]